MQIGANTTGMAAGLCVAVDEDGRDHCVVVVKGSFVADAVGQLSLAAQQPEPSTIDEHHGDPATTSLRRACDYVLAKPCAEILVDGVAHAPGGRPVRELEVALEIAGRRKIILVSGERTWVHAGGDVRPSPPVPFVHMPLRYERAFGGPAELRNPIGVGYHPEAKAREIDGQGVPNLEDPRARVTDPRAARPPVGFAALGRGWQPRLAHAGTYDERWRAQRCPFLPEDFDRRYFMAGPEDQWIPELRGGELVRCVHMAERPVVSYVIPELSVPVRVRPRGQAIGPAVQARLDTVVLEPHRARAELVWRCAIALGKKLDAVHEIYVGELPDGLDDGLLGYRAGRPHFRSLGAAVRWIRGRQRARSRR